VSTRKTIAIIPARANSKRFPGKNLAIFNGLPLLAHSIQYALSNKDLIDEVYVSTNDPKISEAAEKYGAEVVERPESLSGDFEPTVTALKHTLRALNDEIRHVVLLQPTNPLRPQSLLNECFAAFKNGNYVSAMTVSRNYQKFGKIVNGNFMPFNYTFGQRSQDLDPLYFENGLLYITKAELILEEKIVGDKNLPFIVDHPFGNVDIDTQADLDYATYVSGQWGKNKDL
jgi:N-acylneuraminate cytidylyltransferase